MNSHSRNRWIDRLGATGSLTCAVHCALLPVLIATLPGLGIGIFASRTIELVFVVVASFLAVFSLYFSYKRHGHFRARWLLIPGVLVLWTGVLVPLIHDHLVRHAVVMTLGGALVGVGHLLSLRQNHGHIHDATCSH